VCLIHRTNPDQISTLQGAVLMIKAFRHTK
jgi:hypothetical protein